MLSVFFTGLLLLMRPGAGVGAQLPDFRFKQLQTQAIKFPPDISLKQGRSKGAGPTTAALGQWRHSAGPRGGQIRREGRPRGDNAVFHLHAEV